MIRRPPRSTLDRSSAASDVYKRQAHILTLSPPINLDPKWLAGHVAYTITKFSMSMMAIGWAAELKQYRIASNALWPRTTIDTAAVRNLLGGEVLAKMSRTT